MLNNTMGEARQTGLQLYGAFSRWCSSTFTYEADEGEPQNRTNVFPAQEGLYHELIE